MGPGALPLILTHAHDCSYLFGHFYSYPGWERWRCTVRKQRSSCRRCSKRWLISRSDFARRFEEVLKQTDVDRSQALRELFEELAGD